MSGTLKFTSPARHLTSSRTRNRTQQRTFAPRRSAVKPLFTGRGHDSRFLPNDSRRAQSQRRISTFIKGLFGRDKDNVVANDSVGPTAGPNSTPPNVASPGSSAARRARPATFTQQRWDQLPALGLTYLQWPVEDWPTSIKQQILDASLPMSIDELDQDAVLQYPREYWWKVDQQDPYSRINYLAPAWLLYNKLMTQGQRLKAVRRLVPGAISIEPHYLPFWMTTILMPTIRGGTLENNRILDVIGQPKYRSLQVLISAAEDSHWAGGVLLPSHPGTIYDGWLSDSNPGQEFTRDMAMYVPLTSGRHMIQRSNLARSELGAWEPFLDHQQWSAATVPPFRYAALKSDNNVRLDRIASFFLTQATLKVLTQTSRRDRQFRAKFFASPIYLPVFKIQLSGGGIALLDLSHRWHLFPRVFNLQRRAGHHSRVFDILPVDHRIHSRSPAQIKETGMYLQIARGPTDRDRQNDPAERQGHKRYSYVLKDTVVPLAEILVETVKDRGPIERRHWKDESILPFVYPSIDPSGNQKLLPIALDLETYIYKIITSDLNRSLPDPNFFALKGLLLPKVMETGVGRYSPSPSSSQNRYDSSSPQAKPSSRQAPPPPPPSRTSNSASAKTTTSRPAPTPRPRTSTRPPYDTTTRPAAPPSMTPRIKTIPTDPQQHYDILACPLTGDLLDPDPKHAERVDKEVRENYLALLRLHHPDLFVNAEDKAARTEMAVAINAAYDAIGDLAARERYHCESS